MRVGILLLVANSFAAETNSPNGAFQILESLAGKWAIRSGDKTLPIGMVYEVGSRGSIVTEQFGKELSVFYQDHQKLMMIHFCNARNQPRLRLNEITAPGLLQFDAFEVSNMTEKSSAHVQQIIYKILDAKKIDLEIVWDEDGSRTSEKYSLLKSQ